MPAKQSKTITPTAPEPAKDSSVSNVPPAEITMLHQPTPAASPPPTEPVTIPSIPETATPAPDPQPPTTLNPRITTDVDTDTPIVTEESSTTKWVVIIVVLILLIVAVAGGAFYYLTQYKFAPAKELVSPEVTSSPTSPVASDSASQTPPVSQSDEIQAISDDVNNTNLEGADQELQQIEKEL